MATETGKKTKAPAKSKSAVKAQAVETEGAVKAAPAVAAKKTKATAKAKTIDVALPSAPSHAEIAQLAERYWVERGWQDGFAEHDWLRAERELLGTAS